MNMKEEKENEEEEKKEDEKEEEEKEKEEKEEEEVWEKLAGKKQNLFVWWCAWLGLEISALETYKFQWGKSAMDTYSI